MKPVLRFAALFAATLFLFACHDPSAPLNSAVTGQDGQPLKIAFHFKDARVRLVPIADGKTIKPGELDSDARALADHLKTRLEKEGYRLVSTDNKADAVISYKLLAFATTVSEKTFVRHIIMGLDLQTNITMGKRHTEEKNRFQTRQKGINWHLWNTETAQRKHAFAALMETIDEASTVNTFLADKTVA